MAGRVEPMPPRDRPYALTEETLPKGGGGGTQRTGAVCRLRYCSRRQTCTRAAVVGFPVNSVIRRTTNQEPA